MNASRAVETLAGIVAAIPTASDDELVAALMSRGLAELDAERLVAFAPMACGRAILTVKGARFPSTYLVRNYDSGREARGQLAHEPVFRATQAFIDRHGLSSDPVLRLAERSAEVNAAQQLSGDLTDAVFTETLLIRLPVDAVRRRRWWRW